MLFVYKCQLQKFHEKSRNVKCMAFCIKKNGDCKAFLKVSGCLYIKTFHNCFMIFVYIKTCALSFDDGSHCNFHSYTKIIFCETFLYTQKAKKSLMFIYGIPRALLSSKIVFCIMKKVNNSIATKLCVNLINNRGIFLKQF